MKLFSPSQIIFFVFTVAIVSFTVFQHYNTKEKQREKKFVFPLISKENVTRISFVEKEKVSVDLEKNQDQWVFLKPKKEKASKRKVDQFLDNILHQQATILEVENLKWEDYGLNQPDSSIKVVSGEKEYVVHISHQKSF